VNCPTEQNLHRLHDGELAPAEAPSLRAHAEACAACGAALAGYAAVGAAVRAAALPQPSGEALRRWATAGRARSEQAVRRLAGWLTTAAAAAIVVAVVTGGSPGGSESPVMAVSAWERTMFASGDAETNSEQRAEQLVAASLMAADLSADMAGVLPPGLPAGSGDVSWH
jgi:anti-sigma factor RsiW